MNYDETAPFDVAAYRDAQKALPGADALYRLLLAHIEAALPQGGRVLIVGAGGGREIEALGGSAVRYEMTGVDPSADMLAIARRYTEQVGASNRVQLVQGEVPEVSAPPGGFDAATSMLVMHFLPDSGGAGGKAAYLAAIRKRLRKGAVLLHADVSFEDHAAFERAKPAFLRHARLAGLDKDLASAGPKAIEGLPIIGAERTAALLTSCGFAEVDLFYAALWYRAWVAYAA